MRSTISALRGRSGAPVPTVSTDRLLRPPLPTSCCTTANFGSVPKPDSCTAATARLFDQLVGATEQRDRHGEAQHLGGLQVDDQLDLGGLLDR
jgi:hypothetical protein